jgi:7-cyano-7-deazaguanine synthase
MAKQVITRLLPKIKRTSTLQPLQRYLHNTTSSFESYLEHPPPLHSHATVVLVSGGLESTALLSHYNHWSHATEMIPLFINYGQNNARKEQKAATAVCQHLKLPPPEILTVTSLAGLFSEMQRGEERQNRVSFRNLMLLTLGASAAAEMRASHVALAVSKDHGSSKNDDTEQTAFFHYAESLLHALEPPISLLTPLVHLNTSHVVQLGEQANAPWELTWSCIASGEKHCGVCGGCKIREEALASVL